ncbi:hypothetical protein [Pseudomonas sp. Z2-11]
MPLLEANQNKGFAGFPCLNAVVPRAICPATVRQATVHLLRGSTPGVGCATAIQQLARRTTVAKLIGRINWLKIKEKSKWHGCCSSRLYKGDDAYISTSREYTQ